jgi:hypothetical protein
MLVCEGYIWSKSRGWLAKDEILIPELWPRTTGGRDAAVLRMDFALPRLPPELDKRKNLKIRVVTVTLNFMEDVELESIKVPKDRVKL